MRKSGFFPRLALVNLVRNGRYYGPYLLSCGGTRVALRASVAARIDVKELAP